MMYWFITGSSKGLGNAIADELLRDEKNIVYGFSRECSITHQRYHHKSIDLSDTHQLQNFAFPELESTDTIVLINNAATLGEVKYTGDLANANIISAHTLNIIAPHVLMNAFIAAYKNRDAKKVIINITSGAASSPYDGWSIYCSGKAALDMLTRTTEMELQLRNNNIEVYAIAPGILDTNMQIHIRGVDVESFSRKKKFEEFKNENKLVSPEDAAKALIELILHSENITQTISRL